MRAIAPRHSPAPCATRAFLLLSLLVPGVAFSQGEVLASTVPPATRVRVVIRNDARHAVKGPLTAIDSARVAVAVTKNGSVLGIPWDTVSDFGWSVGHDRRHGAGRGAIVGLALGAALYASSHKEVAKNDYWGFQQLFLLLTSFAIVPATAAGIGAVIAPESWQTAGPRNAAPSASFTFVPSPTDEIRLTRRGVSQSGWSVRTTRDSVELRLRSGSNTTFAWRDIDGLAIRGGRNRRRGAMVGALAFIGLGVIGEANEPTTSTGERVAAFTGAAAVGALIGSRYLGGKGWATLPWKRQASDRATSP